MDNTFIDVKIRLNSKTDDLDVFNEISRLPKRLRAKKLKSLAIKGYYTASQQLTVDVSKDKENVKSKSQSVKKILSTI